jgi:hypothetical protein
VIDAEFLATFCLDFVIAVVDALRGQHRCAHQRQVNTVQPAKHAPCMHMLSITSKLSIKPFWLFWLQRVSLQQCCHGLVASKDQAREAIQCMQDL